MSEKYDIQGDVSEADRRNFNHRHEDCSNNGKIIKSGQNNDAKNNDKHLTRRNKK